MIPGRMRFTSEPGISTRKIPLRVRHAGRFDAPSDKAPKRPFLGGFDSSRTETRRCVFPPQKREKTALLAVGDKSSPDAPCDSHLCAHGNARMRHASPTSRGYWGYWGYFSQTLEITRLFERTRRGYFGGYFRGRGFPRARYPCVCAQHRSIRCAKNRPSEAHSMGRAPGDHGERPDRTFARKTPRACAPRRSIRWHRGTPITKTLREVGVRNGWHPSR